MANLVQDIKLIGNEILWFRQLRENGLEAFGRQGIPTAKTEAWKYTKPRNLNTDDFVIVFSLDEKNSCPKVPFDG